MKLSLKNLEITRELASNFKKSYSAKMGGTQIVIFPCGTSFYFDDRDFYSGRGSRYNSSIKHDLVGEVIVTKSDMKDHVKKEKEREARIAQLKKQKKAQDLRIKQAEADNVYSIVDGYVELSDSECQNNFFDTKRLANTLGISSEDAELLKSIGKTYVFAKSDDGNTYELYHSDLSCNHLSIHVEIATPEKIAEFIPAEWQSAPYAHLVGQTSKNNHFVC